ncbi:MAG TPA: IS256 family transposase [Phenylobacterium sp.]|nr:IS256 family transposase [Phenylobacterium sp.]
MKEDTSIVQFRQPGSVEDPLTEIAREGARRMLATALEAEVEAFVGQFAEERLPDGRQRLVRHGSGPERMIQTGIGALEVRRPKVRDRAADVESGEKVRFTSHILPKWARRSRSLDALLPVLYLRGISTGDFQEALSAILGAEAPNLSPGVISRLTAEWETEHERWQDRDLSARRYVYIWADGVYLQARMEPAAECILVVIGATPEGNKELVGFHVGTRESAQSWRELLVDLKARGLAVAPEIAVGDGALGFWKALDEVFPGACHQRCWVHKVANVLNKVPKSMTPTVKSDLRDIWQAETRAAAEAAMDTFAEKYGTKYHNAVACLVKDRDALLTFFDFPAEHWDHLRTANPIESVFATVRHRTVRTKGALSQKTAKLMVFALVRAASRKWRRLKRANQLPLVVNGIKFTDGIAVGDAETRAA